METLQEDWSGRFFKGKKQLPRFYTYALYDRVFLTNGQVCIDTSDTAAEHTGSDHSMEHHVRALRDLIFRPGTRADVPFIGQKTEIFSEDMVDLYDFVIRSDTLRGMPVYVFSAIVKDAYADQENRTVYKELTTYFSKKDFQVLARDYRLSQNTVFYMFDVTMHVELNRIHGSYVPVQVTYHGTWNIPLKRKETGTFTVQLCDFK